MKNIRSLIEKMNFYVLIVIGAIGMLLMYSNYFGQINVSVKFPQVDLLGYYSGAQFFAGINNVMSAGERTQYLLFHLTDFIMIFGMDILFSFGLIKLLKKNTWIFIIPLFTMLFDYSENILFDLHLLIYPAQIQFLGSIAGVVTLMKFISMFTAAVLAVVFKILEVRQKAKPS